jgi:rhodanese-related sulfurtransferase
MKLSKHLVLFSLLLAAALAFSGVGIAFAQEATVEPTATAAFDIQPVLLDYLQKLPDDFKGVKPEAALKELNSNKKPFLLDVREPKEIADAGFIAGAVSIPLRSLTQNLDKLPPQDQPIIVYCGVGHRGGIAVEVLSLLGYTSVRSIFGGFNAWKAAGLPVATGEIAKPAASDAPAPTFDQPLFDALDAFVTAMPDTFYAAAPTAALKSLNADPKPILIDVRGEKELKDNGYIDGQQNIPLKTLLDKPELLPTDKDQPIIVYCAIGHRGAMAMVTLRLLGYTDVTSIGGGFNNWVKGGLPIVKPS